MILYKSKLVCYDEEGLQTSQRLLNKLLLEPLFWEPGRQNTGYKKATVSPDLDCVRFIVKELSRVTQTEVQSFDSYLLHYPYGSMIFSHKDDAPFGKIHVRANAILKQPMVTGTFNIGTPGIEIKLREGDIFIFEPGTIEHSVDFCTEDRYVLTVGTLL